MEHRFFTDKAIGEGYDIQQPPRQIRVREGVSVLIHHTNTPVALRPTVPWGTNPSHKHTSGLEDNGAVGGGRRERGSVTARSELDALPGDRKPEGKQKK